MLPVHWPPSSSQLIFGVASSPRPPSRESALRATCPGAGLPAKLLDQLALDDDAGRALAQPLDDLQHV